MPPSIEKVNALLQKHKSQWISINGVTAVGVGMTSTGDNGIIISVTNAKDQIRRVIPTELEDVRIEIRETGEFKAL